MTQLNLTKYGQPIKFKNSTDGNATIMGADAMVSQYLNIKKNYGKQLAGITTSDNHACRYYCHTDVAYIFSESVLKALLSAIHEVKDSINGEGCVVLFQGVKKELDKVAPKKNGYYFGRPTVIAAAYYQDTKGDFIHAPVHVPPALRKKASENTADAFEHPGDGNVSPTYSLETGKVVSEINSPVVKRRDEEFGDTDFKILEKIAGKDLTWE
jgi:hypothetical protein